MRTIPEFRAGDAAGLRRLGAALSEWLEALPADAGAAPLLKGALVPWADLPAPARPSDALAADLEAHGLLVRDGSRARLPFQIRLIEDGLVVTDHAVRWREPGAVDPLWGGPTLNRLLVRARGRSALDVGCGCGVMTIAAARFCDRVTGIDVNPRAIAFSRFNAALNGLDNVEFLQSDLFDGIGDARFDHVLFNSPTGWELRARNWLEAGESILERFFTGLPKHLDERGLAQVSLCAMDRRGSTIWHRMGRWLRTDREPVHGIFFEQFRMDAGARLLARLLLQMGKNRQTAFDVTSVARGWLVLQKGAGRSVQLPLDYKREAPTLAASAGALMSLLLAARDRSLDPDDLARAGIQEVDAVQEALRRTTPIYWG